MNVEDVRMTLMRVAHHAYCHDTGCFDGDDISQPEIAAAIDAFEAVVRDDEQREHNTCRGSGKNGCEYWKVRCSRCTRLAALEG